MLSFHEQIEAEEKAAKIGTEIIPWKLNDEDQNLTVPNPVGRDLFNGEIKVEFIYLLWYDYTWSEGTLDGKLVGTQSLIKNFGHSLANIVSNIVGMR